MLNNEDLPPAVETRRLPSPDRHSVVTPLDVRQAKFSTSMRGYERAEVNAFLLEAADGYEQVARENERLRQEVARLDASLTQYRELESSLKSTLMNAQKIADDMRENAVKESERIVREAEGKAESLVQAAQGKIDAAQREVDGLWMKRREAEASVEATISVLQSSLEFMRDRERRGREANVVPHRPHVMQSA